MEVLVPYSTDHPKSRLAAVLGEEERGRFARAMLRDVLDAVDAAGGDPRILATGPIDEDVRCRVTVDDRPLTAAVNAALDARLGTDHRGDGERVAVVMADLALATPERLRDLFDAGHAVDLAIVPGRGGGTNAFVAGDARFTVDYHGASYLDHRESAASAGLSVEVVDSHRLATDVDEPGDLAEVLIHAAAGDDAGRAAEWLADAGFTLDTTGGRVGVMRE